mgnify:CR=1 FL=1
MMIEEWNDTPWRYAPHTQDHDSQLVELIMGRKIIFYALMFLQDLKL